MATCNPSKKSLENLAKSRPTPGPTDRRSNHGLWSRVVGQTLEFLPFEAKRRLTKTDHGSVHGPLVASIMASHRAYGRNPNVHNANATPPAPDQEVLNVEFRNAIQLFAQSGQNRLQFQQKSSAPAPSSASVPSSKFRQDQKGRASGFKSQRSISGTRTYPTCPKCGKNHPGECLARKEGCFGCGQSGHRLRDCPSTKQGQGGNNGKAQSMTSAAPVG
uniref:Polyprotein n=1 Tax=Solanum tuberosum TaxID=4113 RepID=M1DHD0_SOLTU